MRIVVLLSLICGLTVRAQETNKSVVFTAMGCGPYDVAAEEALKRFLVLENQARTSSFIVHCGDIVTGRNKHWPESQYAKVADILSQENEIQTFIVPGDNEWNDQADPDRGWAFWSKHFLLFDAKWPAVAPIRRQPGRTENFAFVKDGVLFIGINKVGGLVHDAEEWRQRLGDNGKWVAEHFAERRDRVHSAVIFAQATAAGNTVPGNSNLFLDSLKAAAGKFAKPILYLHADGHKWYVLEGDWAPNITHVQMDLISAKFPPLQVTVTGNAKEPFRFDRRLNNDNWGTGSH